MFVFFLKNVFTKNLQVKVVLMSVLGEKKYYVI